MKVKTFFIGLIAAFALPWLLVVAYPFLKTKTQEPVTYENENGETQLYNPKQSQRISNGERVYMQENCAACHTQVVRNSFAGSDVFRSFGVIDTYSRAASKEVVIATAAGLIVKDASGTTIEDTRRESNSYDYVNDSYAQIGRARFGPDLMNVGLRFETKASALNASNAAAIKSGAAKPVTALELLIFHLYNPRLDDPKSSVGGRKYYSKCAANKHLFKTVTKAGQGSPEALPLVLADKNSQIVPTSEAKSLAYYLLSRNHHDAVPDALNYGPKEEE